MSLSLNELTFEEVSLIVILNWRYSMINQTNINFLWYSMINQTNINF